MRHAPRRTQAALFALGLIWVVAVLGTALVLSQPMALLYDTIGLEGAGLRLTATAGLAVAMATTVTVGIGLVLRSSMEYEEASERF